jgi:hypothetical protein
MTGDGKIEGGLRIPWRIVGWSAAALALLIPLIGRWPWTLSDFLIMGVLLGGAGLVLELAVRASSHMAYRAGAAVAVGAAFLLLWVNGAVGFLGDEDNPANLMFFGVLAVVVLGAVLARFQPAGMARTLFAAAAAQVLVGLVALGGGLASPGNAGLREVVMGTSLFAALWLVSGGLFQKAAEKGPSS